MAKAEIYCHTHRVGFQTTAAWLIHKLQNSGCVKGYRLPK
jgi:hypothetical protein